MIRNFVDLMGGPWKWESADPNVDYATSGVDAVDRLVDRDGNPIIDSCGDYDELSTVLCNRFRDVIAALPEIMDALRRLGEVRVMGDGAEEVARVFENAKRLLNMVDGCGEGAPRT